MASKYVTLWKDPGKWIGIGNQYMGGKDYRVVYDDKNNAYWGQHKQEDLISKLTEMVGNYTKQIADGGTTTWYNPGIGYGWERFNKFSDQQLQQTKQALTNTQKYLEGIKSNYNQYKDFERSYDAYQGDWNALFDRTFSNTQMEARNAVMEERNLRIEANNRARTAEALGSKGDSSGASGNLAITSNRTSGTGLKTAADKPGSTGFKTGLGV